MKPGGGVSPSRKEDLLLHLSFRWPRHSCFPRLRPDAEHHDPGNRKHCTSETARDDRKPTPDFTYNVNELQVQNPNVALMKDGRYPVGQITAVDVATGNTVWQYQQRAYNYSAVLATAGGLVFNGDGARYFFALDTDTGKKIWQVRLGSMCCG